VAGVNDVHFCATHFRDGVITQVRLGTYRNGAPPDVVQAAGEWMADLIDNDPEIQRKMQ